MISEMNRIRAEQISSVNLAMVRELVLKHGIEGIQMGELRRRSGLSESSVRKYLFRLQDAGLVERSHPSGHTTRWGCVGIKAAFKAARDREAKTRKRRAAKRLEAVAAHSWAELPITRVLVSANEARPLGKLGPSSVWDLAA